MALSASATPARFRVFLPSVLSLLVSLLPASCHPRKDTYILFDCSQPRCPSHSFLLAPHSLIFLSLPNRALSGSQSLSRALLIHSPPPLSTPTTRLHATPGHPHSLTTSTLSHTTRRASPQISQPLR